MGLGIGTANGILFSTNVGAADELLLLDEFPNAQVAYSLRLLRLASENDSVIRVRRSSDNSESSFTANEVTDGTLTSFVGANDGFVKSLFDQSGNNNTATQTDFSKQPQIVSGGNLFLENNEPFIKFIDGTHLVVEDDITGEDFGVYSVIKPDVIDPAEDGWIIYNFTSYGRGLLHDNVFTGRMTLITDTTGTTPIRVRSNITTDLTLITGIIDNNSPANGSVTIYKDNQQGETFVGDVPYQSNTFPQYIGAGSSTGNEGFDGLIGEIIIYTGSEVMNLDRDSIDNKIMDYYNII